MWHLCNSDDSSRFRIRFSPSETREGDTFNMRVSCCVVDTANQIVAVICVYVQYVPVKILTKTFIFRTKSNRENVLENFHNVCRCSIRRIITEGIYEGMIEI